MVGWTVWWTGVVKVPRNCSVSLPFLADAWNGVVDGGVDGVVDGGGESAQKLLS